MTDIVTSRRASQTNRGVARAPGLVLNARFDCLRWKCDVPNVKAFDSRSFASGMSPCRGMCHAPSTQVLGASKVARLCLIRLFASLGVMHRFAH